MPQLTGKQIKELNQLKEELVDIRAKIDKALSLLEGLPKALPKPATVKRKETMPERRERIKKMFNGLPQKPIDPAK